MATRHAKSPRKLLAVTVFFTAALMLFTIFLDFMESRFENSAFYFSESLLFSSFWFIFLPLLYFQFLFASTRKKPAFIIFLILPIGLHLFVFPGMVWLLSYLYYYDTFSYLNTLKFGFVAHFITVVLVYTLPITFFKIYNLQSKYERIPASSIPTSDPVTSFKVLDRNKRINIPTVDILYFSADPHCTSINIGSKKYVINETLKSIHSKIDSKMFVQIQKSVIVNIMSVKYYQSRHNGDYDLVLNEETVLRINRNYARDFKTTFRKRHQDTT